MRVSSVAERAAQRRPHWVCPDGGGGGGPSRTSIIMKSIILTCPPCPGQMIRVPPTKQTHIMCVVCECVCFGAGCFVYALVYLMAFRPLFVQYNTYFMCVHVCVCAFYIETVDSINCVICLRRFHSQQSRTHTHRMPAIRMVRVSATNRRLFICRCQHLWRSVAPFAMAGWLSSSGICGRW